MDESVTQLILLHSVSDKLNVLVGPKNLTGRISYKADYLALCSRQALCLGGPKDLNRGISYSANSVTLFRRQNMKLIVETMNIKGELIMKLVADTL
jgi:hypothetical protein